MNITTNAAQTLAAAKAAEATEITINNFGESYGVTITATEAGYTVTDTTGGDQDADTITAALTIAAEFIETVADEDADWMAVAAHLHSIA